MLKYGRILLIAVAAVSLAPAQTKVAVLNSQKALLDTAEIKKAQLDLEAKYKPQQQEMLKLQSDLQSIQQQMQGGKLSQSGEQEMTATGQRKQRQLQRMQQDLQEEVDRERNAVLVGAGTRMREIVKTMAEAKGLDVVVDTANTVFYKPALDLTAEATAAYDKAYPSK